MGYLLGRLTVNGNRNAGYILKILNGFNDCLRVFIAWLSYLFPILFCFGFSGDWFADSFDQSILLKFVLVTIFTSVLLFMVLIPLLLQFICGINFLNLLDSARKKSISSRAIDICLLSIKAILYGDSQTCLIFLIDFYTLKNHSRTRGQKKSISVEKQSSLSSRTQLDSQTSEKSIDSVPKRRISKISISTVEPTTVDIDSVWIEKEHQATSSNQIALDEGPKKINHHHSVWKWPTFLRRLKVKVNFYMFNTHAGIIKKNA